MSVTAIINSNAEVETYVTTWRLNINIGKEYLEPNCDAWCKNLGGSKMDNLMYVNSNGVCSNS